MKHWTPEEDAELKRLYATEASVREIGVALKRTKPSIKNRVHVLALKKSEGHTNAGRFLPGQTSWNKGRKGVCAEGCKATQFKAGRPAHEAANYLPIGSLRVCRDGYLERKVTDDPGLFPARRWVAVHRLVWEAENGPIPPGHVVVFRPRMHTDIEAEITVDRLELITRRELMARNTVHNYPQELRQVIRQKAVLTRKINDMTREGQS